METSQHITKKIRSAIDIFIITDEVFIFKGITGFTGYPYVIIDTNRLRTIGYLKKDHSHVFPSFKVWGLIVDICGDAEMVEKVFSDYLIEMINFGKINPDESLQECPT